MEIKIRKINLADEARWRELWDQYRIFYEQKPVEELTQHLWKRLMSEESPIDAIVAEFDNKVVGIANYIIHENTSTLTPVCYLQDMFVDPKFRANNIGRALIDWLIAEMKAKNWSRLYWNTKENNYRARGLYDKFTPHSGFLRYVISNK